MADDDERLSVPTVRLNLHVQDAHLEDFRWLEESRWHYTELPAPSSFPPTAFAGHEVGTSVLLEGGPVVLPLNQIYGARDPRMSVRTGDQCQDGGHQSQRKADRVRPPSRSVPKQVVVIQRVVAVPALSCLELSPVNTKSWIAPVCIDELSSIAEGISRPCQFCRATLA